MLKVKYPLSIVIFLLATIIPVSGQTNRVIPEQKVSALMLENRELSKTLYFKNINDEFKPFQISMQSRGSGNVQQLSNRIELFKQELNEENEIIYVPAFTVEIPRVNQVIIVFYYDQKRVLNHRVYDDTLKAHPRGTGRLINVTNNEIIGKIGDQPFKLMPWQTMVSDSLVSTQRTRFQFGYAMEIDGKYNADPSIDTFRIPSQKMRWLAIFTYFDHRELSGDGETTIVTRIPRVIRMLDSPPLAEQEKG